jgi:hypothetical protein
VSLFWDRRGSQDFVLTFIREEDELNFIKKHLDSEFYGFCNLLVIFRLYWEFQVPCFSTQIQDTVKMWKVEGLWEWGVLIVYLSIELTKEYMQSVKGVFMFHLLSSISNEGLSD